MANTINLGFCGLLGSIILLGAPWGMDGWVMKCCYILRLFIWVYSGTQVLWDRFIIIEDLMKGSLFFWWL